MMSIPLLPLAKWFSPDISEASAYIKRPMTEMIRQAERLLKLLLGLGPVVDHTYGSMSSGEPLQPDRPRSRHPPRPVDPRRTDKRTGSAGAGTGLGDHPDAANSRSGPTIFLITHHVEELPPATSQVLLLGDGKPAASGKLEAVLRPEILSKTFGFPVEVRLSNGRYYLEIHPNAWKELLDRSRI